MTRLLITGGAGFVGARLARALLARGALAGERIDRLVLADIEAGAGGKLTRLHENFAEIVQQYIDDCNALPTAAQTLRAIQ